MTGFAHYAYDTIVFRMITIKKVDKMKIIDIMNHPLYIIRENNVLYTESELNDFNHIKIDSNNIYENTVDDFIRYIMNNKL